jgi:hypothetical protein
MLTPSLRSMLTMTSQVLAISNISTSTLTTLLAIKGTNIPAFQTFFNYVLLNLIFTTYTIYSYGWRKWLRLLWTDGWRCMFSRQLGPIENRMVLTRWDRLHLCFLGC